MLLALTITTTATATTSDMTVKQTSKTSLRLEYDKTTVTYNTASPTYPELDYACRNTKARAVKYMCVRVALPDVLGRSPSVQAASTDVPCQVTHEAHPYSWKYYSAGSYSNMSVNSAEVGTGPADLAVGCWNETLNSVIWTGLGTFDWVGEPNIGCNLVAGDAIQPVNGDVTDMSGTVGITCTGNQDEYARVSIGNRTVPLRSGSVTENATVYFDTNKGGVLELTVPPTGTVITVRAAMVNPRPGPGDYSGSVTITAEVL